MIKPIVRRAFAAALLAASMAGPLASPAIAQQSEGYQFLKAVRDRDGTVATDLLNRPGSTVVHARDLSSGETGLHIVIARRDLTWLNFLAQRGANLNQQDSKGVTPLILATTLRWSDGVEALLARGARVDETNSSGETALILAVHLRDPALVRTLVAAGADPDKPDSIAGQSARDYARADTRNPALLTTLDEARNKPSRAASTVFGPQP